MICVKLHRSRRNILAACDSEIVGKKFEEGKRLLDVRESFFKDEEVPYEEAVNLMRLHRLEDSTFNIIGKNSVKAAEEAGIINPGCVSTVNGIPFILILL